MGYLSQRRKPKQPILLSFYLFLTLLPESLTNQLAGPSSPLQPQGTQPGASLLCVSQLRYILYPCCFWQVLDHHTVPHLCRVFSFFQIHVICLSTLPGTQCDRVRTWPPSRSASFNTVGPMSSFLHSKHLSSSIFQFLFMATSWTIPSVSFQ